MVVLYLFIVILFSKIQTVAKKEYTIRAKSGTAFSYLAVASFFAILFYVISSGFKFKFSLSFLVYSLAFGSFTAIAETTTIYALKNGPLSITGLILSYSLLVPTIYGIAFLQEELSTFNIAGMVLVFIALFLIFVKKSHEKFSFKWFICVSVAFFAHGGTATVQKMQQIACNGEYKNEFMIASLLICFLVYIILSIVNKESYKAKASVICGAFDGISIGVINLFVMMLMASMKNAILFPTISVSTIIANLAISIFYYKESLTKLQLIGYAIGTVSIVLLNL